jgi:UDP-N-acetylglucosamine--N-acetylmuramyl-(pentapeptide) pyrophosphoryl-undecaprenol N-acetylglucosamine transferase
MGGFTSVGPVLEAKRLGLRTFLHESNTVAGRANRWLAPWVDQVFLGFSEANARIRAGQVKTTGTPVRFVRGDRTREDSCLALGLDPARPVLLITGGSQGARSVNRLVLDSLGLLRSELPELQFIHLCGSYDAGAVQAAYRAQGQSAIVRAFSTDMLSVLCAADLAVGRAGASTLAEFAAMQVPAVLIPYPTAADNHQWFNARAFVDHGAAVMLEQPVASAQRLVGEIRQILKMSDVAQRMRRAMADRHQSDAAREIATCILRALSRSPGVSTSQVEADAGLPPGREPGVPGSGGRSVLDKVECGRSTRRKEADAVRA